MARVSFHEILYIFFYSIENFFVPRDIKIVTKRNDCMCMEVPCAMQQPGTYTPLEPK